MLKRHHNAENLAADISTALRAALRSLVPHHPFRAGLQEERKNPRKKGGVWRASWLSPILTHSKSSQLFRLSPSIAPGLRQACPSWRKRTACFQNPDYYFNLFLFLPRKQSFFPRIPQVNQLGGIVGTGVRVPDPTRSRRRKAAACAPSDLCSSTCRLRWSGGRRRFLCCH